MVFRLPIVLGTLGSLLILSAQAVRAAAPAAFVRSRWITAHTSEPAGVSVLHFRQSFRLASVPGQLPVRVSADGRFVLYVNGKRVGDGPARSDIGHWKYETFDLKPFLRTGDNVVAAVVWSFGFESAVAQLSYRPAFLLEAEDPSFRQIDTDRSWLVEEDAGRSILRKNYIEELHGYYAASPGEFLDGTREHWNWAEANSDAGSWVQAEEIGGASLRGAQDSRTPWMLEPDGLPPMEYTLTPLGKIVRVTFPIAQDSQRVVVPPHSSATVLFDHGTMTTAYPHFRLQGPGATATVTYAEALYDRDGRKGNRNEIAGKTIRGLQDVFLATEEFHDFSPLAWRAFRYVQVEIQAGEESAYLDTPTADFTAYPFQLRASFESPEPTTAAMWDVSWRTARLDAHDTYMDTPYWEQLQYVGDTRIQALLSYTLAGDDRLARQAIQAINNSRIPDGITQSRYPSHLVQIIPPFSLLWVGMVHDFYMYRNDPEFIREQLPGVRAVLGWFLARQRADGLLGQLPWWNFVDWTKDFVDGVPPQDADGGSVAISLQFAEALENAAELERVLGSAYFADLYRLQADRILQTVSTKCWNAEAGLVLDTPGGAHFSEQTNALAVWLGAVPQGSEKSVMEALLRAHDAPESSPHIAQASYYFRFYFARALEKAGMGDGYLATLHPWEEMLQLGLTTWAEQPEPTRSDSHAWSAHPAFDFLTIVAGIKPAAPGFASLVIEPHPGNLPWFRASLPHPNGPVEVDFYRKLNRMRIRVPENLPTDLVWAGKHYSLHSGLQEITLR